MFFLRSSKQIVIIFSLAMFSMTSCGGGGSDTTTTTAPLAPVTYNASGPWIATVTIDQTACGGGATVASPYINFTIKQTGNNVNIQNTNFVPNFVFTGTVSGNTYTVTTTFPDISGVGSNTETAVVVLTSATTATYNGSWTYNAPGVTCSGTSTGTMFFAP